MHNLLDLLVYRKILLCNDDDNLVTSLDKHDNIDIFYMLCPRILIFHTTDNIRKKESEKIVHHEKIQQFDSIIVVAPSISKQSESLLSSYNIEFISLEFLRFNRKKHILVPTYRILTTVEKEDVCKRYKCKLSQFPIILSHDPQVRYLGVREGCMLYNRNDHLYRIVQHSLKT